MDYTKKFTAAEVLFPSAAPTRADRRDGRVYVWEEEAELAVNVALATNRPLLVRGPSGSGKSSLAASVAVTMQWRYYEAVVSSRTEAQDFLWRFDALRRLRDAQTGQPVESARYIEPEVLWWAFDRDSARRRGLTDDELNERKIAPAEDRNAPELAAKPAVVLIDEIDKADPDVPNNLLVPLGSLEFTVTDLNDLPVGAKEPPLVVITTNDERELPAAFMRRCVVVALQQPDARRLVRIAIAHFGKDDEVLYEDIARLLQAVAESKRKQGLPAPSTAEYLDAIEACRSLSVTPGEAAWKAIERAVFVKPSTYEEGHGR